MEIFWLNGYEIKFLQISDAIVRAWVRAAVSLVQESSAHLQEQVANNSAVDSHELLYLHHCLVQNFLILGDPHLGHAFI